MDLVHPLIETYAAAYTSPEDPLLKELYDYTLQHHPEARMISGPLQGKLLEMISCMIRPHRILEIGTFTGYSALCLAKGLPAEGRLHTIELREPDALQARTWFDRSLYATQIISHSGNAREIIPVLQETWDLVFIDADKPAYIEYFNLVFPAMRQNGFILADNVLFHGQVLEEKPKNKSARGIQAFNEFIQQRTDVEKVMITVRDGLSLIRKI
ncbi:MAG: O-methyltransferase [Bacteroidetes bacterium]|nr:O-methyltransferase [Bacteroidota bacterium]